MAGEGEIALSMYRVEGHGEVTPSMRERYERSRKWDSKINEAALQYKSLKDIVTIVEDFDATPIESEAEIACIRQGLSSNFSRVRLLAAQKSVYILDDQKRDEVRQLIATAVEEGLSSKYPQTWIDAAKMISSTTPDGLKQRLSEKIEEGLSSHDARERIESAKLIQHLNQSQRAVAIRRGLETDDIAVQVVCAKMPTYDAIVTEELSPVIAEKAAIGLSSERVEVRRQAAKLVSSAHSSEQANLLKRVLADPDPDVWGSISSEIYRIAHSAEPFQFRELMQIAFERVKSSLTSGDPKAWLRAQDILMKHFFSSKENETLTALSEQARRTLLESGNLFSNSVVESSLYKDVEFDDDPEKQVQRRPFEKNFEDSETTLLGSSLKEKVIMRHIDPDSFLLWQKLFENHELWTDPDPSTGNKFDYVPIEPILSYHLNERTGQVDVMTGVLDINFREWKRFGYTYDVVPSLEDDVNKVREIVRGQGINHQDDDDNNFCLRFFRDDNGNIDFTRKPRVYLIDFDMTKLDQ